MFRIIRRDGLRPSGYDSATDEFAYAWKKKVGYVADVDTVEGRDTGDAGVDGKKELAPAEGSEPEGEGAGSHGQKNELPSA